MLPARLAAMLLLPFSVVPALAQAPITQAVAAPDTLRDAPLNAMRVLGSHNSYRPAPSEADLASLRAWLGERAAGVEYGHLPLAQQLDLGLRQLEFDPYADPKGGLFAAAHVGNPAAHAEMLRPGAKVLHAPVVDARTLCLSLEGCFAEVKAWSDAHPGHHLITIFVNVRDEPFVDPRMPKIAPFDEAALAAVDASAQTIFGRDHIIAPDDVRGSSPSLRAGVTGGGWPTIRASAGKVMLVLDSSPKIAETYRKGHASLRGRMMFAFYPEGDAEASIFNLQDPVAEEARAKALVAQGFMVRTRADADTREARAKDYSRLAAALRSGAQIISTDYYAGAPDPLHLGFTVRLP